MTLYEMKLAIQEMEKKVSKAQVIWHKASEEVRSYSQLKNVMMKKLLANIDEDTK